MTSSLEGLPIKAKEGPSSDEARLVPLDTNPVFQWNCRGNCQCATLLNNVMDLHMSSLGTLLPDWPLCVFYATRHQVYWSLACGFCGFFLVLWFDIIYTNTYTQRQTAHSGPVDWHWMEQTWHWQKTLKLYLNESLLSLSLMICFSFNLSFPFKFAFLCYSIQICIQVL